MLDKNGPERIGSCHPLLHCESEIMKLVNRGVSYATKRASQVIHSSRCAWALARRGSDT